MIEVVMAVSILAIGILAVGTMQVSAIKSNSTASHVTARSNWAQDKIENLMAMSYDDPWLEEAGNTPGTDSDGNTHQETTFDSYTISWDVDDDNPLSNVKMITVTVTGLGGTTELASIKVE